MSAFERVAAQPASEGDLLDALGLRAAYDQGQALRTRIEPIEAAATALLEQFQREIQRGLWRAEGKLHAFQQGQQQHALRTKAVERFVAAHGGRFDLPLDHWSMLHPHAALPSGVALLELLTFFDDVLHPSADHVGPAFWTTSLLREAKLHLYDIMAANLRREWHAVWQPCIDGLRDYAQGHPDPINVGYLLLLDMLFAIGDLEAFEQTYDAFRQQSGYPSNLFPWLKVDRLRASYFPQFVRLLEQVITVKALRHRADDPVLIYLQRLRDDLRAGAGVLGDPDVDVIAPASADPRGVDMAAGGSLNLATPVLPAPDIIGFSLPDQRVVKRYKSIISRVLNALDGDHAWDRRRAATLGFWYAFLCCRLFKLTTCKNILTSLPVGSESLAVLTASLRGEVAYLTGDYENAQLQYARGREVGERLLHRLRQTGMADQWATHAANAFLGRLSQWHGNVFVALGDFGLAQATYSQVDGYLHDSVPEAALTQAINLGNLAFLKNNLVDSRGYVTYDTAELFKLRDSDLTPFLRLKFERNRRALAEADQYYRTGLTLLPGVSDADDRQRWEAILHANLGNVYWARAHLLAETGPLSATLCADFSDLGTAAELYQQALHFYQAAYDLAQPDRPLASTCLVSVSALQLLLGEHKQAEATQLAVAGDDRTATQVKQASVDATRAAANAYMAAEQAAFDAMLRINSDIRADRLGDDDEQLEGQGAFYPEHSWRIYLTLARVYEHQNQRSRAMLAYTRALQTVERMRRSIRTGSWQTSALQNKLQVYEAAIHFLYRSDPVEYAAQIFDLTEQLKARTFLDVLESTRLNLDQRLPKGLQRRRTVLAERGARLNRELLRAELGQDIAPLLKRQARIDTERETLESQFQHKRPKEVGDLNPPILDWEDCRAILAHHPDTVLLSFTLGDHRSYLLVGDEKGLEVFELPGRTTIEVAVARLLWHVTVRKLAGTIECAAINRQVVDLLLGPAISHGLLERLAGRRILIVPDGILYYLPFELLLVRQPVDAHGQPLDFAAYRKPVAPAEYAAVSRALLPFYMLQVGPIAYVQSMSVWNMLNTTPLKQPDYAVLGVYRVAYADATNGNPAWSRAAELGIEFANLDQTSRIKQVLDAFEGDPQTILRLSSGDDHNPWPPNHQSTEANFLSYLQQHRVRYVLFAGHGVYNDKYPQFSGIIFNMRDPTPAAQESTDPPIVQDGFFGLQDVFELRMDDTELVFLAACQGGIGVLSRGEGVNALTRAFMYRGSPTVIASLWTVDVDATMELVEAFFALLRAQPDADKGVLLQEAKQAVIANTRNDYTHPYFWAPFIVMGRR